MIIKSKWQAFIYNYSWSDWVGFIDGWIPKLALSVPIAGYLILFNDKVSEALIFDIIANENTLGFGLNGVERLRFIYFGLIFLGLSNFIYRLKKPYQFKFGTNQLDYTRTCLELFTISNYITIHNTIRDEGHLTLSGKYYDSEWDSFLELARNKGEGTDEVIRNGDWESAKSKYGGLLRDMLVENFFRSNITRRIWLSICILLSSIGYVLLILPSGDMFIKVTMSSLGL